MGNIINRIQTETLEDIMSNRFERYAKTSILDRALPDIRDGLKPVHRRVLYTMNLNGLQHNKQLRKCADTVGSVLGNFHPHGDTSVYDAMVRMAQWWKQSTPLVDMRGNIGSIDGDTAAAYRYTEAKLHKISDEFLKGINKETVEWTPSFDDRQNEPVVLPVKFPNLIVNGSFGISTGYATNIPPHNLKEVIDGTIKRIESPNSRLETIMNIIKGPDFPTGGTASGIDGIIKAFETGKGRVVVTSKYEIVKEKTLTSIVVTEIPFDVNKQNLVKKLDDIRINKDIDGIIDVRDESDLEHPTSITIDIKKDANTNLIVDYLLKNTDLRANFNYNMVAIKDNRPKTLGLLEILDAYIGFQKEVIIRRTKFDLKVAVSELHIIKGLIKAISILDEIIALIRASLNKQNAKENLMKKYDFSERQAEAIVTLQLHKLSNQDIDELQDRYNNLVRIIEGLEAILNNEDLLKQLMIKELREIRNEYGTERKTIIEDEIREITIDEIDLVKEENCIVVVTNEGYVKRVSTRSYQTSKSETELRDGDYTIGIYELSTIDTLLLFTDEGNYLYLPVFELPEVRWADLGGHVGNIVTMSSTEKIIGAVPVKKFEDDIYITIFTKNGMVKRTSLKDFEVQRYNKSLTCIKLKKEDKVVNVTNKVGTDILITTKLGYGLKYDIEEVSIIGIKAAGVISIDLRNDEVIKGHVLTDQPLLTIITEKTTGKRIKLSDIERTSRARRGVQIIRDVKTNPYYLKTTLIVSNKETINIVFNTGIEQIKPTELPIADRYSTGREFSKSKLIDIFTSASLEEEVEDKEKPIETIDLDSIDSKMMTIDDFLDDIDIIE